MRFSVIASINDDKTDETVTVLIKNMTRWVKMVKDAADWLQTDDTLSVSTTVIKFVGRGWQAGWQLLNPGVMILRGPWLKCIRVTFPVAWAGYHWLIVCSIGTECTSFSSLFSTKHALFFDDSGDRIPAKVRSWFNNKNRWYLRNSSEDYETREIIEDLEPRKKNQSR